MEGVENLNKNIKKTMDMLHVLFIGGGSNAQLGLHNTSYPSTVLPYSY